MAIKIRQARLTSGIVYMAEMNNFKTFLYASPIGNIYCTFKEHFLIKVRFQNRDNGIKTFKSDINTCDKDLLLLVKELQLYFDGVLKEFNLPIKFISGSTFEQKVWLTLREIPYGQTRTYKWLAQKVANHKAYRAIGNTLRKNPLPLILPCHRVIASDGSVGGFSAGTEIKRWLLRHESSHI